MANISLYLLKAADPLSAHFQPLRLQTPITASAKSPRAGPYICLRGRHSWFRYPLRPIIRAEEHRADVSALPIPKSKGSQPNRDDQGGYNKRAEADAHIRRRLFVNAHRLFPPPISNHPSL